MNSVTAHVPAVEYQIIAESLRRLASERPDLPMMAEL
jgi:hypothetical protein